MPLRSLRFLQSCWREFWNSPQPSYRQPVRSFFEELEPRLALSTLTVLAEADAHVEREYANRNYGDSAELVSDRSPERESLIRFDLTGVTGEVQSAKVRVYVTDGSSNGPAIYATGADWTETTVTWNSRPARISGPLDDKASVGSGWLEFDVTEWVTGNGKFSFGLASTSADGTYMSSRQQSGFAPQLVVSVADLTVSAGPDRTAEVGNAIAFAGSVDGGAIPQSYTWDFGDGQTAANTLNPSHTYAQSGVYTVRFTAQDATGAIATDTAEVIVQLEPRPAPSTLTVLADADARVERENPNRNYGDSAELVSDRSPERESLIRFDLTGVTGEVQSAKVRVYVTDGSSNAPAIYATGADWTETTVTWNSRPARISGPLDDKASVGSGWLEFDVTEWVTGNGKFSFALASTSADGTYMSSRQQSGFAPQLVVSMADLPADLPADLTVSAGPDRTAEVGNAITFAGSVDGGAIPQSYTWDFGDGQTAVNTLNPSHTYAQSGVYTVRFTAQDATGAIATDSAEVVVHAAAPSSGVGQHWSSPRQIGTLDIDFVDESSGLAISRAFPDRLYHINDSGDGGYFYISDKQGQNMQRVRVNGFNPADAEDLAYGSVGGKNYLVIADIGDNGQSRSSLTLVFIEEQATYSTSVDPAFTVKIRYPDGPRDAEGLAFHPNGDLYIMTKENPARVYRLPAAQWQNASTLTQTLQFVGEFGFAGQTGSSSITGMDISPDGRTLIVLTYSGALELEARLVNGVLDFSQYGARGGPAYKVIKLTKLPQQESIAYLPNGRDFLYTSEYHDAAVPILELDRLD